jgi:hypothetical protein
MVSPMALFPIAPGFRVFGVGFGYQCMVLCGVGACCILPQGAQAA